AGAGKAERGARGGAKRLSREAQHALRNHAWPGNVRELKNTMERAALLAAGPEITAGDLGLPSAAAAAMHTPRDEEPDRGQIEAALERANGVVSQAAADLGLSRQALYRRMDKLGIART